MDRTEQIRARAHRLWENEGCPEGREDAHWSQALAEIEAEEAARQSGAGDEAEAGHDDHLTVGPDAGSDSATDGGTEAEAPTADQASADQTAAPKKPKGAAKPRKTPPAADGQP